MKSILIISIFLLASNLSFSQNKAVKAQLSEIEGDWEIDDNNNVTYTKIIEAPELDKDEIYSRVLSYFTYNYASGEDVAQSEDKEAGRVIGKGLYRNVHFSGFDGSSISCYHILRTDIKEGKARVILSLTDYAIDFKSEAVGDFEKNVSQFFPVNPKGGAKNFYGNGFYKSHQAAKESLDAIEKAIKEGNTSIEIENDDW